MPVCWNCGGEIANYLRRRFDLEYDYTNQILVTVGGSEAIDLAIRVLVNPGTRSSSPCPPFVCYGPLTEMAGGVPVYVELTAENGFRLTPEQLKAAITPRTKALVPLPQQPHRRHHGAPGPGGHRPGAEGQRHHGHLRRDLCRAYLRTAPCLPGQPHPAVQDRTVVVNGFKSHAMTGWRMGYVCAPQPVIAAMTKLHQFGIMSAPTTSQYAAIEAMRQRRRGHCPHEGGV